MMPAREALGSQEIDQTEGANVQRPNEPANQLPLVAFNPHAFAPQNTQNRDSAVLHLKLDELIRTSESARD
jgi:hypothetical protein